MSNVNQITVTSTSGISVVTAGTQGLQGASTLLGADAGSTNVVSSDLGSTLIYDHGNTQWLATTQSAASSLVSKLAALTFTAGGSSVTGVLDEDNMSSNSATKLATQQSIKAYIDAQQDTVDTLAEILALSNTTSGTDISVTTNDKVQFRDSAIYINSSADGQLDIVADTEIQISATTIDINGAINASGEIIAASLDISGNVDIDGVLEADAVTINGSALVLTANDFTDADHSKLDGIESNATTDQTNAEIKAAVEAATNSNTFTDADHAKLNAIEAAATADQTNTEIRTAVEAATDSNVFTNADHTKLNAIEASADVTDTTNVTAAGALMDSELSDLAGVKGVTISTLQVKPSEGAFANGDKTKLDAVESSADVTDTANVTSAGALMDSEVTNLAQVKAFDESDYATAAQGAKADAALPKAGGAMSGAITTNSTFDGRDVATDGTKLDGIEASATADQSNAEIRTAVEAATNSNVFTDADHTKLNAVEASADVTDSTNVVAALTAGSGITIASNGTIAADIAANSVTMGTDTTGNYVATVADAGNSHITVANSGSESAAVTLNIADNAVDSDQIAGDAIIAAKIADNAVTADHIADGAVTLSTHTSGDFVGTATGTSGEIEITGSGTEDRDIVIGLPDNVTVGGNLIVTGNYTVNGDTTTISTANLAVEDPLFKLAKANASSDSLDIGFYGLYDTSGSQDLYSGLFRDANDSGKWKLFKDLQAEPTTTVNVSGTGYAVGTLVATLDGTAAVATDVTTTANNSANETVFLTFVDGATGSQGIETDTGLTYTPSSGNLVIGGELAAATLDISGNIDIDGTANLDVVDIDGAVNIAAATTVTGANKIQFRDTAIYLNSSADGQLDIVADTEIQIAATTVDINGAVALNGAITGATNITLSGELDAATGDFSGDVDVDGTLEADAITVNGTGLATVIAGTTVTNATNSAHVSVADNEDTDEENLITFIEGASATGNVGLESDGNLSYNPSTGTVSATVFKGNVDAVNIDVDGTLEADAITIGGTALAIGDGGLTTNNFTDADHTKLNGIEASATADQTAAQIKTLLEDGIDSVHYVNASIDTDHIGNDQVTVDKLANSINTAIAAGTYTSSTSAPSSPVNGEKWFESTNGILYLYIDSNWVDISTATAGGNATHTGEVTGSGALTIADNIVDEANLKCSNNPTNGHFLSAQSGNTGGLTWAAASGGSGGAMTHVSTATVSGTSTAEVIVAVDNTYKTYKIYTSWEVNSDSNSSTEVCFTDGGTAVTDNSAYTGARNYNGSGGAVNGNGKMVTNYPDSNLPIASQEWTIFMDGNNIKKVIFNYGITRANQGSSSVGQGSFSPHNYSASGNIDGISWKSRNTQFKAGSTFILYGLAE